MRLLILTCLTIVVLAQNEEVPAGCIREKEVEALTFTRGRLNNPREGKDPIEQIQCLGSLCEHTPEQILCTNDGWDGQYVNWGCETDELDTRVKFRNFEVSWDGCRGRDDLVDVVIGSAVVYFELVENKQSNGGGFFGGGYYDDDYYDNDEDDNNRGTPSKNGANAAATIILIVIIIACVGLSCFLGMGASRGVGMGGGGYYGGGGGYAGSSYSSSYLSNFSPSSASSSSTSTGNNVTVINRGGGGFRGGGGGFGGARASAPATRPARAFSAGGRRR